MKKYVKGDHVIYATDKMYQLIYAPQGYMTLEKGIDVKGQEEEHLKGLSKCTLEELKAMCKERGLKGYSKLNEEELIKLLEGEE